MAIKSFEVAGNERFSIRVVAPDPPELVSVNSAYLLPTGPNSVVASVSSRVRVVALPPLSVTDQGEPGTAPIVPASKFSLMIIAAELFPAVPSRKANAQGKICNNLHNDFMTNLPKNQCCKNDY